MIVLVQGHIKLQWSNILKKWFKTKYPHGLHLVQEMSYSVGFLIADLSQALKKRLYIFTNMTIFNAKKDVWMCIMVAYCLNSISKK